MSFIDSQCKRGIHTGVAAVMTSFGMISVCVECRSQLEGPKMERKDVEFCVGYAVHNQVACDVFIEVKQNPISGLTKKDDKAWQS